MITNEMIKLENGVKVPKLALGVQIIPEKETEAAVKSAIAMGYRQIDTAQAYDNEAGVDAGVKNCGVPREELFVTSKIAAENKSYESSMEFILEVAMHTDNNLVKDQMSKIKKDGTLSGAITYKLTDLTTPVKLTSYKGVGGVELGSQEFAVK